MHRTLLKGGTLISMVDGRKPFKADLLIEGGRIANIDANIDVDAEIVDVSGHIVLPGFVDCHRHVWQAQLRAITHDWSLKDYIRSVRMRCGPQYRPEDMRIGNEAGMMEAMNAGITTVLDHCHNIPSPEHAEAALEGTFASGIRSMFAFGLAGNYGVGQPFELDERIKFIGELRTRYFNSEKQLVQLGLNASDSISLGHEQLVKEVALARELQLPVTLHALVFMMPGLRTTFPSEIQVLSKAGLCLPNMVWVHMNFATQEECQIVADSGGAIAVTPEAEIQMGMGHPCFVRAKKSWW